MNYDFRSAASSNNGKMNYINNNKTLEQKYSIKYVQCYIAKVSVPNCTHKI